MHQCQQLCRLGACSMHQCQQHRSAVRLDTIERQLERAASGLHHPAEVAWIVRYWYDAGWAPSDPQQWLATTQFTQPFTSLRSLQIQAGSGSPRKDRCLVNVLRFTPTDVRDLCHTRAHLGLPHTGIVLHEYASIWHGTPHKCLNVVMTGLNYGTRSFVYITLQSYHDGFQSIACTGCSA